MTRFQIYLAILSLVGTFAFMGNAYADEAPTNCTIRITQVSTSGQKEKIQFGTRLNSRAECIALAHMHERVAPPPSVSNKKVVYRWKTHGKRLAMR